MIASGCEFGTVSNPRGSEWHRWDPHIHAPGTLLNDQFSGDWETYLARIEGSSPAIEALGITDYFLIPTYRKIREWKNRGRLGNVALIFPNVEMRLDIKTGRRKPINLHLLSLQMTLSMRLRSSGFLDFLNLSFESGHINARSPI